MQVKTLCNYRAKPNSDYLSFQRGDIITEVEFVDNASSADESLGCGNLDGKRGLFLLGLTELILETDTDAIAVCDYSAHRDGYLSFKKGQIINVIANVSDKLYKGQTKGKVGLVPKGLTKVLDHNSVFDFNNFADLCFRLVAELTGPIRPNEWKEIIRTSKVFYKYRHVWTVLRGWPGQSYKALLKADRSRRLCTILLNKNVFVQLLTSLSAIDDDSWRVPKPWRWKPTRLIDYCMSSDFDIPSLRMYGQETAQVCKYKRESARYSFVSGVGCREEDMIVWDVSIRLLLPRHSSVQSLIGVSRYEGDARENEEYFWIHLGADCSRLSLSRNPFISIYEYYEGGLGDLLSLKEIPFNQKVQFCLDIARGIAFLHEHCILLNFNWDSAGYYLDQGIRGKLIDFSTSMLLAPEDGSIVSKPPRRFFVNGSGEPYDPVASAM